MIGEIIAVGSALAIASSAVISKSLTARISPLLLQTMRSWFGGVFLLTVCLVTGRAYQLTHIPWLLAGLAISSALLGIAIGDTMYMRTLSVIEVSKAFPVVKSTQILLSMILAGTFLSEEITWTIIVGAVLIIGGIYLAAFTSGGAKTNPSVIQPAKTVKWLILAVMVGFCWAASFCIMKIVLREVEPLVANSLRLPMSSLALTFLVLGSGQGRNLWPTKHGRAAMALLITTGILSYGVGGVLTLYAVDLAGVTRSAILTSLSPIFVLGLSLLFLREGFTLRLGLGTFLSVSGTVLLMLL